MNEKRNIITYGVIAALSVILFVDLWYFVFVVNAEKIHEADLKIQEFFFSMRNPGLNIFARVITEGGYRIVLTGLCVLLLISRYRLHIGVPVTIVALGEYFLNNILKNIFERPRPDEALWLMSEPGFSFPSGHSVASMATYGLLFMLILKYVPCSRKRTAVLVVCFVLAFLVGLTRIYLGVHYSTDVLAGWFEGIFYISITLGAITFIKGSNHAIISQADPKSRRIENGL